MGEQELTVTNPQAAIMVSHSRKIGPDTWEIQLVDGRVMTIKTEGNRLDGEISAWWLPPAMRMRITADDNGMRTAEVPDGLKFGPGEGLRTEYDLTSLAEAQRWLQDTGDVSRKLLAGMSDVKRLIDGPASTGTGVGGFPKATELKTRHDGVYAGFESMLRTVAEELYDAHDALGQVMRNYVSVEDRNRMTAEQMTKILTEQTTTSHDLRETR
ncbi:hypothetical protein AB0M43_19905 [Longispora sp. NPDC051575]|uniref:hypothetical protein n=1 Tax=Longispora sp. NPDC051575 TaxID=3154943 RepID=UPI00343CCBC8